MNDFKKIILKSKQLKQNKQQKIVEKYDSCAFAYLTNKLR